MPLSKSRYPRQTLLKQPTDRLPLTQFLSLRGAEGDEAISFLLASINIFLPLFLLLFRLCLRRRGLYLRMRGLYLRSRGLFLRRRGLFLRRRGLYLRRRGLYLRRRGLFL